MEQNAKQKNAIRSKMPLKTIAKIGILGAIAAVLMLIEIPLPFAPRL